MPWCHICGRDNSKTPIGPACECYDELKRLRARVKELEAWISRIKELEAYQRNAGVWMAELIEKNDHLLAALQSISEMTDSEAEFNAAQVAREALNPETPAE